MTLRVGGMVVFGWLMRLRRLARSAMKEREVTKRRRISVFLLEGGLWNKLVWT